MSTRPVVVGTDGTEPSQAAVAWAVHEAQRRQLPLRIVYVYEGNGQSRYDIGSEHQDVGRQLAEAVTNAAYRDAQDLAPALEIQTEAVVGHPVATLLDIAGEAELMVLGHRGAGGFAGLALGSVSQRVATHAGVPVVVVRGRRPVDGPIAVGVDDSATADHVLGTAFDLAAAQGCALTVVRSYLPVIPLWLANVRPSDVDTPEQDTEERAVLDEQLAPWRAKFPHVPTETVLTHDSAAAALVDASRHARLVVVGSRGRGIIRGALLGSTGQQLLHHADCPVLIVRHRVGLGL